MSTDIKLQSIEEILVFPEPAELEPVSLEMELVIVLTGPAAVRDPVSPVSPTLISIILA